MSYLKEEQVEWVTNDNGELGVKIGEQFFFLYKGESFVYESGLHDNGTPLHWRPVFKREFGECAHPINHNDYSKIGTVSLGDSDLWKQLPPAQQPAAAPVSGDVALPEIRCYLMVDGYDHETNGMDQFSGGRTGGIPLVALPDARTYGQQCSDAALERAAVICEEIAQDHWDQYKGRGKHAPNNPRRADTHADGCSDGANQCADAIRALKGGK